ncbi:PREDICTED: uncharacterized protein LOC108773960, partial [Cyphomyrmex costatus]|uniref:uncharacterized protein LOC108773960 n=1 Tax=Cyphomyrmex costatus TaxID=456900 RepID=UPI0008522625
MTGAEDVSSAIVLQREITELLKSGGFQAHKWCSNATEVLARVSQDNNETITTLSIDNKDTVKAFGLEWNPREDTFQFAMRELKAVNTKRQMFSAISKFFDPLGLVGPIITRAKLFMQETWKIDCNWDDQLPDELLRRWKKFMDELMAIGRLRVPRCIVACDDARRLILHGFCDASELAYGACIYMQVENSQGEFSSRVLCSKSRIAPIKTVSLPRLELCGAVLLARLLVVVRTAIQVPIENVRAWSDSEIVLYWIKGDPSRWKPFVCNRVSEIIETLPAKHWSHVSGKENPADVISRGASPRQLENLELWWAGPPWLLTGEISSDDDCGVKLPMENHESIMTERRKAKQACQIIVQGQPCIQMLLENISFLTKIERVLAYCKRFASNTRKKASERAVGQLSITEANQFLKITDKLAALTPFLDEHDILRVGGRLQRTNWNFERKQPILLPSNDRFTKLLFEREHVRLLHANQQLLLNTIRERYWPLKGKSLARSVCRNCVHCSRVEPEASTQLMGELPDHRVQPSRCFHVTGVDFAGPIITLVNKGRGRKTNKSYVTLFICFATKAIHLEATSELSTAAFLATLRRFVSRRGCPKEIWSDNGTNFIGANRELERIQDFVRSQLTSDTGNLLVNEGINWKFIPPNAPHMGGLWEAGIKSCKYHLKRIMGNVLFTFEELSTALTQIEACLNSRPLTPMTSDPSDLKPLTPAHFLVGGPLTSVPDLDVTGNAMNRLTRWQLIQRVLQDFWKRWAAEYLSHLQGRTKWKSAQSNLSINDLVVIRDENLPPLKWKLGRVVEIHPGRDGLVRVVSVRVANGIIKRPIVK